MKCIYYKVDGEYHKCPIVSSKEEAKILRHVKALKGELVSRKEFAEVNHQIIRKEIEFHFNSNDFRYILDVLSYNKHRLSIKVFEKLLGIRLAKTWKVRYQQIQDYYGEKIVIWEKTQKQVLKQQKNWEESHNSYYSRSLARYYIEGKFVSPTEFLTICREFNVKVSGGTQKYMKTNFKDLSCNGEFNKRIAEGGKMTPSVWKAVCSLNKQLGIKAKVGY